MSARFEEAGVAVEESAAGLRVRCRLLNRGRRPWRAAEGFALGWQIFDPVSEAFLFEGEWRPAAADVAGGAAAEWDLRVPLPAEHGPYRVYISPVAQDAGWFYLRGWPFLLIDAEVDANGARLTGQRVTTRRRERWRGLPATVRKAFSLPVLAVWRNRGLIRSMVRRDVLGRYRGSFGDVAWTILHPLLLMLTYFFVFGIVLQARFGNDPSRSGFVLYFLAGMLPWLPFSEAAGRAPQVILEHRNFVKKLVFPVEILPVNLTLTGLVTQAFALAIFAVLLLAARGAVPVTVFWLPVLLLPQALFTAGVCWFLAALGAFVRDLGQMIGFALTLVFFLSPICYPEASLPAWAVPALSESPVYALVRAYRAILLEGQAPDFTALAKLWAIGVASAVLGHAWFHKFKRSFADVV